MGPSLYGDWNSAAHMFHHNGIHVWNCGRETCSTGAVHWIPGTTYLDYLTDKAIMQKHIGFFDFNEHSTGLLTSHLASDASMVQSLVGQQLANTTMSMFTVITGIYTRAS